MQLQKKKTRKIPLYPSFGLEMDDGDNIKLCILQFAKQFVTILQLFINSDLHFLDFLPRLLQYTFNNTLWKNRRT